MRLSNSKKQLAKIISENGGWLCADFAAQQDDGEVWFSNTKPIWNVGRGTFAMGYEDHFTIGNLIANRHQTILSRDEYFHLYPAPDADGWIEWKSQFYGDMPVPEGTEVDIMVGGTVYHRYVAEVWKHWGTTTKYRLYKSPIAQPETEAPAGPTIEQLAADYRAKLAIAQKAREEADSHRCGAEAALEKLVAAGKALGLVLGIDKAVVGKVIDSWRDLKEGDVIRITSIYRDDGDESFLGCIGMEAVVTEVPGMRDSYHPIKVDIYGGKPRVKSFDFIRRP